MKKYIFSFLFVVCFSATHAQFTLTPDGFVPTDHPENDYVVYEFEGKSQSELYRKVILFITTYNSPQDMLSEVPEDMITIQGTDPVGIQLTKKEFYSLDYTLKFHFKENKIRIDNPTFVCYDLIHESMITLIAKQRKYSPVMLRIFNPKNGKVEMENVKSQLESFFNDLCNRIAKSVETGAEEDW